MTKKELGKYAGNRVYALCERTGKGMEGIDYLTVYEITEKGTLRYCSERMGCVANFEQCCKVYEITRGNYVRGRPTAAKINIEDIDLLIIRGQEGKND